MAGQGGLAALLRSLIRSATWCRMRQGVYATKRAAGLGPDADPVRAHVLNVLAAQATVGGNAVASYHSAALLHRLGLLTSPPTSTVTLTLPPPGNGTGHSPRTSSSTPASSPRST